MAGPLHRSAPGSGAGAGSGHRRALQLRWFDHYPKGVDNGVDSEAPIGLFIQGDNVWRQEQEWLLARTQYTNFYLHSGGGANGSAGG